LFRPLCVQLQSFVSESTDQSLCLYMFSSNILGSSSSTGRVPLSKSEAFILSQSSRELPDRSKTRVTILLKGRPLCFLAWLLEVFHCYFPSFHWLGE
jgi:hypothetical protein